MPQPDLKRKRVELSTNRSKYSTDPKFLSHLANTSCNEIRKTKLIFVCSRKDKVIDVWKGMQNHNILSCPVILENEKYYGFIDVADIIQYFVKIFGEKKLKSAKSLRDIMLSKDVVFSELKVDDLMKYPVSRRNPFHPVRYDYSLFYAVEMLANEYTLHRVPIINLERQLLNILTQSYLIAYIKGKMDSLGSKKLLPVFEFDCVQKMRQSEFVSEDENVMNAFSNMVDYSVTSIAMIDKAGNLTGTLSMKDMKEVISDDLIFSKLYLSCKEFHDKVEGKTRRLASVTLESTLEEVINKLTIHKIHNIHVLKDKKLVGRICLKDVLYEIIHN